MKTVNKHKFQLNKKAEYRHLKMEVVSNQEVYKKHYLLTVNLPNSSKINVVPGQFFHVVCDPYGAEKSGYPLTLRRPFSVHRIRYSESNHRDVTGVEFLYQVVGKGTESLSKIKAGTLLDAIGPCGNGFSIGKERKAIVVAGGIGIAPLVALVEQLRYLDKEVYVYFGVPSEELLPIAINQPGLRGENINLAGVLENDFSNLGAENVRISTDDGSAGYHGFVTALNADDLSKGIAPKQDVTMYACGPYNMLKTLSRIAGDYKIDCQVLLEERMACGIGACLSCVCDVVDPDGKPMKKRVCRDGPVFNAAEIIWKN